MRKILTQKQAEKKKLGSFYRPTKETYRTGACPAKQVLKIGYERKSRVPKSYVEAVCIKDKGMKGKVLDKYKVVKLGSKNALHPYGYTTKLSSKKRLECLLKAAKVMSYATVFRRINVLRTFVKNSSKKLYDIYDTDIKNLRKWREEHPDMYKKKHSV
jgi:hypothetical protein